MNCNWPVLDTSWVVEIQHCACCSGAVSQAQFAASQTQGLHGRVKSYAETLQKLNEADRSRQKMSAVAAFATAAALDPDGMAICHHHALHAILTK